MSPKDRVRANIYKELFEEEKVRNKRYKRVSLSLFFIGILGTSSYYTFVKENFIEQIEGKHIVVIKESEKDSREKVNIEDFFNKEFFQDENRIDIDTKHVFGFDFQS